MEADAERRRIADEAAALRKAEEEKLRAEREEAERKEREALNGVPDIVEDVPKDARARGYRRVNGHKVDRQEPLQAVQGKEVNVKFSNDVVAPGNVTVIDASLLQPSHIQGVRNPLHFIDEKRNQRNAMTKQAYCLHGKSPRTFVRKKSHQVLPLTPVRRP